MILDFVMELFTFRLLAIGTRGLLYTVKSDFLKVQVNTFLQHADVDFQNFSLGRLDVKLLLGQPCFPCIHMPGNRERSRLTY